MRNAYRLVVGVAAAVLTSAALAGPASASPDPSNSGDTTVTFTVLDGPLSITVPESADLLNVVPGGDVSGALGTVTVSDGRASADATWDAVVRSTEFQTGGGTAQETVLPAEVDYWSGPATSTTGTGTFTPGQATTADRAPMDAQDALEVFTHGGGTGNNTAAWNPTLQVNAPLDSIAGIYIGTVTNSVD